MSRASLLASLALLGLAGCAKPVAPAATSSGTPTSAPQSPASTQPAMATATVAASAPAAAAEPRCLPLVSGCGCAYVCAESMFQLDATHFDVVHDLQDSRLDRVTIERWCFDAQGHGTPEAANQAKGARCLEVFFDDTPCGGECIPSVEMLRCQHVAGRCAPAAP